jgi:hypothetical protein
LSDPVRGEYQLLRGYCLCFAWVLLIGNCHDS